MAKRKIKPKVTLQIVYCCDHCGNKFKVSHQRSDQSAIIAAGEGIYVVFQSHSTTNIPQFFCSEECIKAKAELLN